MQKKQKKNIKARKGKCFLEHLLLAAQAGLAYEKRNCSKMMHDFNQLSQNSFITTQKSLLWRMIFSNQTISFLYIKIKLKKNSYVLPPHSEFIASPRRQAEGETAFSFEKKCPLWKHLLVAGVIQCFPPSLCCSQPRQGEASLLCEQGFQNSPFIIKAAKLADANRLPPFILNCKINFGG